MVEREQQGPRGGGGVDNNVRKELELELGRRQEQGTATGDEREQHGPRGGEGVDNRDSTDGPGPSDGIINNTVWKLMTRDLGVKSHNTNLKPKNNIKSLPVKRKDPDTEIEEDQPTPDRKRKKTPLTGRKSTKSEIKGKLIIKGKNF